MTKVDAKDIHGYEIDDYLLKGNARIFNLSSTPTIIVGKDGQRIKAELKTASNDADDDHDEFFETLSFAQSLGLEVIIAVDSEFNGEHAHDPERMLVERLRPHNEIVKRGFSSFFDGVFDQPEYIQMLTQCSNPEGFSQFLQRCLQVGVRNAEISLSQGEKPNYSVRLPNLVSDIKTYLGRGLKISGLPPVIAGRSKTRPDRFSELFVNPKYVSAMVQKNGSSFTYSPEMQGLVSRITLTAYGDLEKSEAIFNWITNNIRYGKKKRKPGVEYRGALQVYEDREGVCGESAALQVTMERLAGNIAFLVEVGKEHAGAAHIRPDGKAILIDTTTPRGFDQKYDHFMILSDDHSLAKYNYGITPQINANLT